MVDSRWKALCIATRVSGALLIAASIAKFVDSKLLTIWLMSETGMPRGYAATIGDVFNSVEFVLGIALLIIPTTAARIAAVAFAIAVGYHAAALALPQVRLCPCLGGLAANANPYVLHSALLIVSAGACIVNLVVFSFSERVSP